MVTMPLNDKIILPRIHPLYLNAKGSDNNPIPTRILIELNIVCGTVLYHQRVSRICHLSNNHFNDIPSFILHLLNKQFRPTVAVTQHTRPTTPPSNTWIPYFITRLRTSLSAVLREMVLGFTSLMRA